MNCTINQQIHLFNCMVKKSVSYHSLNLTLLSFIHKKNQESTHADKHNLFVCLF